MMHSNIDGKPYEPPTRGYHWCDNCKQQRLEMWIDKDGNCTRCGSVVHSLRNNLW